VYPSKDARQKPSPFLEERVATAAAAVGTPK
jgi:hypothetical protein